jgi:hypothetical protein
MTVEDVERVDNHVSRLPSDGLFSGDILKRLQEASTRGSSSLLARYPEARAKAQGRFSRRTKATDSS